MKPKQEEQPLKLLINELLSAYGLEGKINEMKLTKSWEDLVGRMIAKHTDDLQLKRGLLIVKLDSAALRQELSYEKEDLIKKLNSSMGKNIVKDILFR